MSFATIGRDPRTGKPITLGDIERRSGLYVLGKPGMGKSSLLVNLIISDIQNGHGLFFLDPHADAISDILNRCQNYHIYDVVLLDPETETHSFGINILNCSDITSLKQRTDTYSRAYGIFHKLWEDEWGPWLQLIIQNTIYAFVENQEYTLSEVPLFLNNPAFRNHLVGNMRYNKEVRDFWQYEFGAKRDRDQQDQVQSALTRVRTLLNHQYVRDIVGQKTTTVDLGKVMAEQGPAGW